MAYDRRAHAIFRKASAAAWESWAKALLRARGSAEKARGKLYSPWTNASGFDEMLAVKSANCRFMRSRFSLHGRIRVLELVRRLALLALLLSALSGWSTTESKPEASWKSVNTRGKEPRPQPESRTADKLSAPSLMPAASTGRHASATVVRCSARWSPENWAFNRLSWSVCTGFSLLISRRTAGSDRLRRGAATSSTTVSKNEFLSTTVALVVWAMAL
mmetsp:Transcript_77332/g.224367  ORF Transcript_77332/g.224367 Transcript_77332/m.224367 type:complete len:218 (-) Transcript_77332:51-704(-)